MDGRVTVNGETVRLLGTRVDPASDAVAVDGTVVRARRKMYVALNKPPGYICSRRGEEGRRTIGELIPKEWGNLYSVGRLDCDSEGLIFLTNDGEFSLHLTHPRYQVSKTYLATVEGRADETVLRILTRGVWHEGERLKAQKARLLSASNSRSVIELVLTEGKNREVRRLFASQGLTVTRLQRVQIGRVKLGELRSGRWRTLTEPEVKTLLTKI